MSNADPVITPAQQAVFAVGAFAGLSFGVTGADPGARPRAGSGVRWANG